jgi:Ser/Thr protein kinase RdoA (MazF antagonist)
MAYLDHLGAARVPVALPVRSRDGLWVERLDGLSASVLTWAPGERVEPGGRHWTETMLREWGRHLARIHRASRMYRGPSRWDWRDEVFLARADELIPASDREARGELERAYTALDRLPREPDVYGMTHADFGAQNFHYDPAAGITSFDFGNCCTHWFASDLVISLSTLRRLPERERFRDAILDGYREIGPLDERVWEARDTFMRLRIVYVYLSRLMKFGASPTPEEQETLRYVRGLVGRSPEWP